jgi:hypothetical protein
MLKDNAFALADALLTLINSRPRTPTRDEMAYAIMAHERAREAALTDEARVLEIEQQIRARIAELMSEQP